VKSQDIIVKSNNDTILCKIVEVSDSTIKYITSNDSRTTTSSISTRFISSYEKNAVESANQTASLKSDIHSAFWMSFSGGYSRFLGKIIKTGDFNVDKISNDMANGFAFEAAAEYYFKWRENDSNYGIAVNLDYNSHAGNGNNIPVFNMGTSINYSETLSKLYFGPAFAWTSDYKKIRSSGLLGMGAIYIFDKMNSDFLNISASNTILGMYVSVGVDYKLNNNNAIGLNLSLISGSYDKLKVPNGTIIFDQKMSAASLQILLAYYFRIK
jgi:hypothetical protein